MARPPINDNPMTTAERARRYREKRKKFQFSDEEIQIIRGWAAYMLVNCPDGWNAEDATLFERLAHEPFV